MSNISRNLRLELCWAGYRSVYSTIIVLYKRSLGRTSLFLSQRVRHYNTQWRFQEFHKTGGRGPGAVEFLGLGFVFILYVFGARVVNKIHIVNIVYWIKSKYMRVIQSKFTKTPPPPTFFKPVLDQPWIHSFCPQSALHRQFLSEILSNMM